MGANGPVVQKLCPNENRDIKTAVKKCNTATGRLAHLKNYKTGVRMVRTPILEAEADTGTSSNPFCAQTSNRTPSQKHVPSRSGTLINSDIRNFEITKYD